MGLSWVLYLRISHKVVIKLSTRALSSFECSTRGESASMLVHVVVGRIQFRSYWIGASLISLPNGLLPQGRDNMAAGFNKIKTGLERQKPESFCYLILEVISYHIFPILFLKSK